MGGITTTLFQRPRDPQFNNTTLLLSGNFPTNGAQNNTFLDSSSNGFSITRNGNTTQGTFSPFSQTGWGNYFDGSSALSVSYLATNFGTGDFTVETFVFPTARTSSYTVLLDTRSAGTSNPFVFGLTGTNGYLYYYNGSVENASTTTVQLNTWSHIAISRSGSTVRLFVNGTQVLSVTDSSNLTGTSTGNVSIAQDAVAGSRLTGYLSNFRVVKGGALYTSAFTPSTTPLTTTVSAGTVSLLTCQSNRFVDNSASPLTINITGTPSIQAFSPFVPSGAYTTTAVGGSGYFDGTGDYLTVADSSTLEPSNSNFTIECWIYPTATGSFLGVFSKRATNANYSPIQVLINSGTMILYASTDGSSWAVNQSASSSPPLNAWSHIAVVRSGTGSNNLTLYLNGTSVATGSVSSTALVNNTGAWAIGADAAAGTGNFAGYISGFRYVLGSTVVPSGAPTTPPTAITDTQLLLNYTNAGIVDSTAKNVLETVGNAQISTAVSRFGGSSIYLDGTGDWLLAQRNWSIASGENFTIEGWIYLSSSPSALRMILSDFNSGTPNSSKYLSLDSSGVQVQFGSISGTQATCSFTFSANTWYHLAVVRSSNTVAIYIDGTSRTVTNASQSSAFLDQGSLLYVGKWGGTTNYEYVGYIDDLRITRGVARYTANFNVPTIGFTDR